MSTWIVRLRSEAPGDAGRLLETATYRDPVAAMDAYRMLLARPDLDGKAAAAVFKPPRGAVPDGNVSTYYSRFDHPFGQGRIEHDDPRLDPMGSVEHAERVQQSLVELGPSQHHDWLSDPRPLGEVLRDWHGRMGLTRNAAAEWLGVARSTYDGWCAGRPTTSETMLRRLMWYRDRYE